MSDLQYLAATPISEEAPAGEDARGTPEYEALLEGIAKLNSMQGMTPQDWEGIARNATEILQKQARDIPVAAYLGIALSETNGLEGWSDGVSILSDMLERWWEQGFPPLKRLRARGNALDWWHERSKTFLERPQNPASGTFVAALLDNLERLDKSIASRLPDCSALFDLRELVRAIPLLPEPEPAPEPEVAPEAAAPRPSPVEPAQPEVKAAPQPQSPPAPPQTSPPSTSTGGDPEKQALEALMQAARQCYDVAFGAGCPTASLPFRAFYMVLWGNVRQCPPDENGTTRIPAPDASILQAFQTQLSSGKGAVTARNIALQLPSFPFWLDMHRLLHEALLQAGPEFKTAALLVEQEVLAFTQRLSGVESLRFAEEIPFANEATRDWLRECRTPATATTKSPLAMLKAQIAPLLADRRLGEALECLREARRTDDGALRLRIRLEELRLLHEAGKPEAALAVADDVEKTLDERHLATWDPALCEEALKRLYTVHASIETPEERTKTRELLTRLAVLAPSALLGLSWPQQA